MTAAALPALVDVAATRDLLHAVAEHVLAAEQYAANHELALHAAPGGFTTGWFPANGSSTRVRVEGGDLVREFEGAASQRSPLDPAPDPAAGAVLVAWWHLGADVLGAVDPGPDGALGDVVLWPEHFDIAVTVTAAASANLGFSPGDGFCAEPYVYVGPWEARTGRFWNAPFGAYRTYTEVAAGVDAAAFLAEGLAALRT